MIVRIEALLRKWKYGLSRDEWSRRLLNLPNEQTRPSSPGLVMMQIDGLGLKQFERAMEKGRMPFLASLIKKEAYIKHRHYTGLPSNTPAVQGMLFYGVKACVPAFSFRALHSGQVCNMFTPESAATIEVRLKDMGEPLLKGGSSYGNIFTGGASEPHFCVASIGWGGLLKTANPFFLLIAFILHFNIFIRGFFLIVVEFFLALWDGLRSVFAGKNILKEISFIPLRVMVCVVLREIVAASAKIDIARGLPVIHLNFAGYDEQAHHRGPASRFAHWSLRGIDASIARVWKAARESQNRDYDVFIYSDHGQEGTVSYAAATGESIRDAVNRVFTENFPTGKWYTETMPGLHYWRAYTMGERFDGERVLAKKIAAKKIVDTDFDSKAVVAAMGPVAHIYAPKPLSLDEKEKLAQALVTSAKIPIVVIPGEVGKAYAWNQKGKFLLPDQITDVIQSDHPFLEDIAKDMVFLSHHAEAGDFVLFGWNNSLKSITFSSEHGSHAGPGLQETSGFALLPVDAFPRSADNVIYTKDLRAAAQRSLQSWEDRAFSFLENPRVGEEEGIPLRIMTYNVHSCLGRDGKISPGRIARIIARHRPDVVALQELNVREELHQAEIIARQLSMQFHFHPSFSMKKGLHGNAIFSRFPMKPLLSGSLPKLPKSPWLEPRGALWVELDVYGKKVQIINTHLSLSQTERSLEIEVLLGKDWIGNPACQGAVILCGDFNSAPQSKICGRIGTCLKNAQSSIAGHRFLNTLPSFYPVSPVDHVFISPGIRVLAAEAPRTKLERIASDHLPLIVEVLL